MSKVRKVKRRKTYKVNINRKRLRNKMRKLPTISCPEIKEAWENGKSIKTNLLQMGLSSDPNKSLKIPNSKSEMIKTAKQLVSGEIIDCKKNKSKNKKIPKKIQVAMTLEENANAPTERMFRLPNGQVQFLTYLMDKYGDDYEAMARDKKNYYQLTWRRIRSKINTFKNIPEQYAEYLVKKGEIVLDNPESLEETRKKIAAENVKKYCAPKKIKKKKKNIVEWMEESIDSEETDIFNTENTLQDEKSVEKKSHKSEKKLALFSDDESDHEQETKKKVQKIKTNRNKSKQNQWEISSKTCPSSDTESDMENNADDDNGSLEFKDLDNMSDDDVSDDDILDDDEFVTDSD